MDIINKSIYIKKNVCLFVCLSVRYAFKDRTSKRAETFQKSSIDPGEGRHKFFFEKKIMLYLLQAIYVTDQ